MTFLHLVLVFMANANLFDSNSQIFLEDSVSSVESQIGDEKPRPVSESSMGVLEAPFGDKTYVAKRHISMGGVGQIVAMVNKADPNDKLALKVSTGSSLNVFREEPECVQRVYKDVVTDGHMLPASVPRCPDANSQCSIVDIQLTTPYNVGGESHTQMPAYWQTLFNDFMDLGYIIPHVSQPQLEHIFDQAYLIIKTGNGPAGAPPSERNTYLDANLNNMVLEKQGEGAQVKVIDWSCGFEPVPGKPGISAITPQNRAKWYGLLKKSFLKSIPDKGFSGITEEEWAKHEQNGGVFPTPTDPEFVFKITFLRLWFAILGDTDTTRSLDAAVKKLQALASTPPTEQGPTSPMGISLLPVLTRLRSRSKTANQKLCDACRNSNKLQWCRNGLVRASPKVGTEDELNLRSTQWWTCYNNMLHPDEAIEQPGACYTKEKMISDMAIIGCPAPVTFPSAEVEVKAMPGSAGLLGGAMNYIMLAGFGATMCLVGYQIGKNSQDQKQFQLLADCEEY